MVKLTKRKERDGLYRVLVNGKPSPLIIVKGEPPKFGMRQEWPLTIRTRKTP